MPYNLHSEKYPVFSELENAFRHLADTLILEEQVRGAEQGRQGFDASSLLLTAMTAQWIIAARNPELAATIGDELSRTHLQCRHSALADVAEAQYAIFERAREVIHQIIETSPPVDRGERIAQALNEMINLHAEERARRN